MPREQLKVKSSTTTTSSTPIQKIPIQRTTSTTKATISALGQSNAKAHSRIGEAGPSHSLIKDTELEFKEAAYAKPYSKFQDTKASIEQATSISTPSSSATSKPRSPLSTSSKTNVITDITTTPIARRVATSSTTRSSLKKHAESLKNIVMKDMKTTSSTNTMPREQLKVKSSTTTTSSTPIQKIPIQRTTSTSKATISALGQSRVKEADKKQFGEACDPRVKFEDFIPCANGLQCICGMDCKNGGSMQCLAGKCVGMNSRDNIACAAHHSTAACDIMGNGKCEFEIQECGYVPPKCEGPITWMTKNWPEHSDYYPDFESVTGHKINHMDTVLAATYLFCKDAKCQSFNARSLGLQPGCSLHKNRKQPMKCLNK